MGTITKSWIKESTTSYTNLNESKIKTRYDGSGYQWWLNSKTKTVWADGYGERFSIINPSKKITLVEQNFTGNSFTNNRALAYKQKYGFWFEEFN